MLVTRGWRLVGRRKRPHVIINSECFDKFPFPDPDEPTRARLRDLGERLDAHRKRQQAAHPGLTLTQMYNVLEKLRAGEPIEGRDREIYDAGLVGILRQLHDDIDAETARAYGWPADLADDEILRRLVALNAERAAEEARGLVRWLRPEFQNPDGRAARPPRPSSTSAKPPSRRGRGRTGRARCPSRWRRCARRSRPSARPVPPTSPAASAAPAPPRSRRCSRPSPPSATPGSRPTAASPPDARRHNLSFGLTPRIFYFIFMDLVAPARVLAGGSGRSAGLIPSCSRITLGRTSSTAPGSRSPSWNGP